MSYLVLLRGSHECLKIHQVKPARSAWATAIATDDLPLAVGPTMTTGLRERLFMNEKIGA
ncbi:MAG: hypothetical protein EB089_05195 [Acidimicrobiia bacterium]|nr:hypothetical protein [Acidimicrobiia bacterium]